MEKTRNRHPSMPLLERTGSTGRSLPSELIGIWNVTGYLQKFEITLDATYYVIGTFIPWEIKDSGDTLVIGTQAYRRVGGPGESIIGVWSSVEGEEMTFRADGSYTSHWEDGEDFSGTYEVLNQTVAIRELRALIVTEGNQITFDVLYGVNYSGTYTLESPDQWTYHGDDGFAVTFQR